MTGKAGRILYVSALKRAYSRDQNLRAAFADLGFEIIELPRRRRKIFLQAILDTLAFLSPVRRAVSLDAVVLACFSFSLYPLASILAKRLRVPLITDFFVSRYESHLDRHPDLARSLKTKQYLLGDKIIFHASDVIITDTQAHLAYYQTLFGNRDGMKDIVVPVGASDIYHPAEGRRQKRHYLEVTFWGSFIPLHGVDVILKAAKLLEGRTDLHFTLIGRGQTLAAMNTLKECLRLTNVQITGEWLSEVDLVKRIHEADIALGIFGKSEKAQCVIPNKVYQAMACGVPMITMKSPAIAEFEGLAEVIVTCDNTPLAVARTIRRLASDAVLRRRFAEDALVYYHNHFGREARVRYLHSLEQFILQT